MEWNTLSFWDHEIYIYGSAFPPVDDNVRRVSFALVRRCVRWAQVYAILEPLALTRESLSMLFLYEYHGRKTNQDLWFEVGPTPEKHFGFDAEEPVTTKLVSQAPKAKTRAVAPQPPERVAGWKMAFYFLLGVLVTMLVRILLFG